MSMESNVTASVVERVQYSVKISRSFATVSGVEGNAVSGLPGMGLMEDTLYSTL
jgi:hypothetical protein